MKPNKREPNLLAALVVTMLINVSICMYVMFDLKVTRIKSKIPTILCASQELWRCANLLFRFPCSTSQMRTTICNRFCNSNTVTHWNDVNMFQHTNMYFELSFFMTHQAATIATTTELPRRRRKQEYSFDIR